MRNNKWVWTETEQTTIEDIKESILQNIKNSYYDALKTNSFYLTLDQKESLKFWPNHQSI